MMDAHQEEIWPVPPDRVHQLLSIWHTHRSSLLYAVVGITVLILLVTRPKKQSLSSLQVSPVYEDKRSLPWTQKGTQGTAFKVPRQENIVQPSTSKESSKGQSVGPKVIAGRKPLKSKNSDAGEDKSYIQTIVFYSSLTGTTERLARGLVEELEKLVPPNSEILSPQIHDLSYIDLDDFFISGPKDAPSNKSIQYFYCLLIPSYDIDTILDTFLAHLDETHNDFRIDTAPLSSLSGYSVFGIGDKTGWPTEEEGFCSQAIEVDKWMAKLTGRKRAYPLGLGDVKDNVDDNLNQWAAGIGETLQVINKTGALGEGVPGSGDPVESGDESEEEPEFPVPRRSKRQKTTQMADLEDVGGSKTSVSISNENPIAIDFTTYNSNVTAAPLKEMVPKTSPTHAALTKQGYTIIGSHSGVKICRWTKSALRGRGSCYKNSFYGIRSHLCMETTPSLSCSNKCVFCWRHGTNPVSTTWRWQVDDPEMIFNGAKEGHYQKIKMMRGVPGVRADRFEEAMRIRHCALSLVGEPIFYPRINEFLALLHSEHISSFLVCNAQHPDQLDTLQRVTQLYVSIDASNRESLRRIDRPLHRDFWERFQKCLDILREKRFMQRTVFRLTLVKGFNVEDEVEGYADLVAKGLPCFVEVKGVTYCGTSSSAGAGLTMQNVPFYEEIVTFVVALDQALARRGLEYGIAAEHAHSCCILLASKRFHIKGVWNTLINYSSFFNLLERGDDFAPEDYCAPTPEWALWGNGGFDPADERVDRKGRPKVTPAPASASASALAPVASVDVEATPPTMMMTKTAIPSIKGNAALNF